LIYAMMKCGVFIDARVVFLNIIQTSFDFNELEYKAVSLN